MQEALKIGVSGVRGVVGESFTPQLAATFAQAFGTFVGHGPVVIGRDTRLSGAMIECAVVAGLQSVGCKPVLAGVVPTPTVLILARETSARGGIAITASHNPAAWNALKFADRNGLLLDEVRVEELLDIYHQQDFPFVPESEIPAVAALAEPMEPHWRRIRAVIDLARIRAARFRVAVDCCNGVGALHTARFLRNELGCEVETLHEEPSGVFARDPEPVPDNLQALCERVRRQRCQIGLAQDPDGDRLALVDETGRAIGEDFTLAFAIQQYLDAHEKGPVAVNFSTSRSVEFIAAQRGVRVIRTRTGEINVSAAMLKHAAVVGGENIGGVIVPRVHPCRDSYVAMALVLELMAASGQSVSELRAALPRYVTVRDKVSIRGDQAPGILRQLRRHYEKYPLNLADGVYVDGGDFWIYLRRSNTESVIRITTEADTADAARRLADEARALIERLR